MKRKITTLADAEAAVDAYNKKAKALQKQENALTDELEALVAKIEQLVDRVARTYVEDPEELDKSEDND